jgi:tetratricopeptide (TPR) repeat protein
MLKVHDWLKAASTLTMFAIFTACASGTGGRITPTSVAPRAVPNALAGGQAAALARADVAWQAGDYDAARGLYEAIVRRSASAPSVAVFRLATLTAWDNRLDEGVSLFRRYVAMEPRDTEGRVALARAIAWTGRYSEAVAVYDSVIAGDPNQRSAILGRAQTLAWAGDFDAALATYKEWVSTHRSDREAAIEYARVLAWSGDLEGAESLYTELSATGNANAKKGLARVIGWKGDLQRSERTWRQVLVTDPADAEALTGLAQVLSWQGRQADAEIALQLALRANPAYGDARTLMRWVQADLRPSVTVSGLGSSDSDDNRSTGFILDYVTRAPWNGTVGLKYSERWANFAAVDSRADGLNVFARWQPSGSSWQLRADAGATHHSSTFVATPERKRTIPSGALRASGNIGRALTVGLGASRTPFDETALLIANGVVSSEAAGEVEIALPGPLSLAGAASHARLTGGTLENSRNAFSSTLRWTHNRRWSLGIGARQFGYDTTSSDGYFAPKRYRLAELSGRGRVGGTLGWNAEGDVGLGTQSIEFFGSNGGSRRAERLALTAGYRFTPAHELSAGGSYANVAGPGQTGGSEYKFYAFSLRARVGF